MTGYGLRMKLHDIANDFHPGELVEWRIATSVRLCISLCPEEI
jgi:hypothetical protein